MKIASKNHVFNTLKKYELIAKKGYGQNFLVEEKITKGIVENSHIDKNDTIIEIGPGLGALTEELLENFNRVIAIEIDKNMVRVLKDTFKEKKLGIIEEDFLKVDLKEIFDKIEGRVSIVSNLPYYITSDILEKIILFKNNKINKIVVMMQKEVANKFLKYDDKIDTVLKFLINNYCNVNKVLYVSKNDFIPRPNVDSMVLELELIRPRNIIKNEPHFVELLKECLKNKRKVLLGSLVSIFNEEKEEILKAYKKYSINENCRIEELTHEQFISLINDLM